MKNAEDLHFMSSDAVGDKIGVLFYHKFTCSKNSSGPSGLRLPCELSNTITDVGINSFCSVRIFLRYILHRIV